MTTTQILIVEDDVTLRDALAETLSLAGHDVLIASDGQAALELLATETPAAVVTDYQMKPMNGHQLLVQLRATHPNLPVLLMTAHGSIEHAVSAMLEGATDYLVKPFSAQVLIEKLTGLLPDHGSDDSLVACDPVTLQVLQVARRVAGSDTTVLLTGESGTGKEVFARAIHQHSERASGPFVALNCAAIPENMLEAVLFGHEKGAFTGAHEARAGKFEQAQGGTLMLDEISEMDLGLQAKLLRVLQEKEVERLGGKRSIALNVRILATTNRDLAAEVAANRFREDLYYRLSVFPLELPPLRERPGDIIPLARHFIHDACGAQRPPVALTAEAEQLLLRHSWPGNVRELQNLVQRALILCSGNQIRERDLPAKSVVAGHQLTPAKSNAAVTSDSAAASSSAAADLQGNLQNVEGRLILDALQAGGGSRKKAAAMLGISPRTLRYKLARLRDAGVAVPDARGYATA